MLYVFCLVIYFFYFTMSLYFFFFFFFFFNDTATTEIYTFPTLRSSDLENRCVRRSACERAGRLLSPSSPSLGPIDRKSTRLNSSHMSISYAVFCLKKKKNNNTAHYCIKKKKTKK